MFTSKECVVFKVVHIIVGLNVGGAELMLKRLVLEHRSLPDVSVTVISLTELGVVGTSLRETGVQVYCMGLKAVLDVPMLLLRLRRLLKQIQPDVVQTWMYHADLLGGLAARLAGIRNVVWNVRSTHLDNGVSRVTFWMRKACALFSHRMPRLIICAAETSKQAHILVGYSPDRMIVIPNGFDLSRFTADRHDGLRFKDELCIPRSTLLVVSIGRYNADKDHFTFVEAASLILSKRNDVKFLLVGNGLTPTNKDLCDHIERTGNTDSFILLGQRSDVLSCLRASDVFCLHSVTEGFPNVLGEAMAVGLSCLTTDVGDAAYLVDDDSLVVPPSSPKALADKLQWLLSLTSFERSQLGEIASSRIKEAFDLQSISRRYIELYRSL